MVINLVVCETCCKTGEFIIVQYIHGKKRKSTSARVIHLRAKVLSNSRTKDLIKIIIIII